MSTTSQERTSTRRSRSLEKTGTKGIYRRGGGYVVRYRGPDGNQRQEAAATLAEARKIKAAHTTDIARGEFAALSRVTFKDYACEWLGSYKGRTRRGIRPETVAEYGRELGLERDDAGAWKPVEPARGAIGHFGNQLLTAIEPRDIKAYAAVIEKRGVRPNTVRLGLAPVKAMLATAVEDRLIRWNPAAGVRLTNAADAVDDDGEDERAKALTKKQLDELLKATPAEWQLLVLFLAHMGLRISEAAGLQWGDLEFGRRPKLKVRRRLVKGRLAPPKSRYSRRTLKIPPGVARALWGAQKAAGVDRDPTAPVFQRNGKPLDRHAAFRAVKEAGKAAGVPWVGLHTLRHTCATLHFLKGWNAKQVQLLLGHHSAAFTLATYVHLLPEDMPDPRDFVAWPLPATSTECEDAKRAAAAV